MSKIIRRLAVALVLLLSFSGICNAQETPYTEGSVWSLRFVKTKPGMTDEYLRNLAATWKVSEDALKKEGTILSYTILLGESANPQDFDIVVMSQYKNMAAFDGLRDKEREIDRQLFGADTEQKDKQLMVDWVQLREIYGGKIMREITFK
jgi:hypothetical protein